MGDVRVDIGPALVSKTADGKGWLVGLSTFSVAVDFEMVPESMDITESDFGDCKKGFVDFCGPIKGLMKPALERELTAVANNETREKLQSAIPQLELAVKEQAKVPVY